MKFITAIYIASLAVFANGMSSDPGASLTDLSHPTPPPLQNPAISYAGPSLSVDSSWLDVLPTGLVTKRSDSPSGTTVFVPPASSSLYDITETPL
ncbi:hypothetical protein BDW62DRAFT_204305 [Aspergillus aurantiobrunneus]